MTPPPPLTVEQKAVLDAYRRDVRIAKLALIRAMDLRVRIAKRGSLGLEPAFQGHMEKDLFECAMWSVYGLARSLDKNATRLGAPPMTWGEAIAPLDGMSDDEPTDSELTTAAFLQALIDNFGCLEEFEDDTDTDTDQESAYRPPQDFRPLCDCLEPGPLHELTALNAIFEAHAAALEANGPPPYHPPGFHP